MKFGFSKTQISKITSIFADFPEIEEVTIFGSRAMGNFKKGSDVDLALKGQVSKTLVTRISRQLNSESNLPYIFDVMSYGTISNAELKKHIDEIGKILYRKKQLKKKG